MANYSMSEIVHPTTHMSLLEILHKIQGLFDDLNREIAGIKFRLMKLEGDG